jgi:hypothetical protein
MVDPQRTSFVACSYVIHTGVSESSFSSSPKNDGTKLLDIFPLVGQLLPTRMFMRTKTFGVRHGTSCGFVYTPNASLSLDWTPDVSYYFFSNLPKFTDSLTLLNALDVSPKTILPCISVLE